MPWSVLAFSAVRVDLLLYDDRNEIKIDYEADNQ